MEIKESTQPKPRGVDSKTDPVLLAHGRYGTDDMVGIFGPENTVGFILQSQVAAVGTMSKMFPEIVPPHDAAELSEAAESVDMARVRAIEEKTGHDILGVNGAWSEKVSPKAAAHINKARTSADSTETAKALQFKKALYVIADSVENLRDIVIERALEWADAPHMDTTHLYDAAPTYAGRPFAFYAEMLQSDLDFLAFVYANSLVGKWADATGNHHSAKALGIDGMKLQEEYCKRLGIKHMTAPAQIPGREFITDVVYTLARSSATMDNLAHFIRMGRGDDIGIFRFPRKKKGSSAMPHKDAKGGNPSTEEQTESYRNFMIGALATSLASCRFDYGRDLSGSASDRIMLEDSFKWGDHVIRNLADVAYKLELDRDRCRQRIERSYGVTTAEQVMTFLTDRRRTKNPMSREHAHDLTGELATTAYDGRKPFIDVLLENDEVTRSISEDVLREIADPLKYVGQSREIIQDVFSRYHGKRTLRV